METVAKKKSGKKDEDGRNSRSQRARLSTSESEVGCRRRRGVQKPKQEAEKRVIYSMEEFREQVYDLLLYGDDAIGVRGLRGRGSIPRGRVTTYGDIAQHLGSRSVARHVGWALNALKYDHHVVEEDHEQDNDEDECDAAVPWWRVVNSKGEISFRPNDRDSQGVSHQMRMLQKEGVVFVEGSGNAKRIKDFDQLLWTI